MGRKKGREYSASGKARLTSTDRDVPFRRKRKILAQLLKKISPPRRTDCAAQQGASDLLLSGGAGAGADDGVDGDHHQTGTVVDGGTEEADGQAKDGAVDGAFKEGHGHHHQDGQVGDGSVEREAVEDTALEEEHQEKGQGVAGPFDEVGVVADHVGLLVGVADGQAPQGGLSFFCFLFFTKKRK